MNHKQIAAAYRMRYPERSGGVIVIYGAHVAGWCEAMPLASDWEPGCFAVDGDGNVFVSVGGDPRDGAERWEPVKSGNSESLEKVKDCPHLDCPYYDNRCAGGNFQCTEEQVQIREE